ncbi:hypothetical protein GCM10027273_14780 [Nocardioides pakistanensis]
MILVVATAVAVVVFVVSAMTNWPPEPPTSPLAGRTAPDQTPASTPTSAPAADDASDEPAEPATDESSDQLLLVVLGDSFTAESDVSDGPEWPQLLADSLDLQVAVDAVAETGYVSDADGDAEPFADRVDDVVGRGADVIVVAGGVDDLGAHPMQRITDAAEDVVTQLVEQAPDAQLVLVSPFSYGGPGPLTEEFTGNLREIADAQGIPYVDATGWLMPSDDYFSGDRYHPADAGQREIATRMEQALLEAGIAEATS